MTEKQNNPNDADMLKDLPDLRQAKQIWVPCQEYKYTYKFDLRLPS